MTPSSRSVHHVVAAALVLLALLACSACDAASDRKAEGNAAPRRSDTRTLATGGLRHQRMGTDPVARSTWSADDPRIFAAHTVLALLAGDSHDATSTRESAEDAVPRRIVSLTLATDELLHELVGPERVVGITWLADDPRISNVADRYPDDVQRLRADLEAVLALRPDLVCTAPYNDAGFLRLMRDSGLDIHRMPEVKGFQDLFRSVRSLAARVGACEAGEELVEHMRGRLEALDAALGGVAERPRVLFWSKGWTPGSGTMLDAVIRRAGGRNVAADLDIEGHGHVPEERVLAADPDWLLLEGGGWLERGRISGGLKALPAVKAGRIVRIPGRLLHSLSHHIVRGTEVLARALHPERLEDAPR